METHAYQGNFLDELIIDNFAGGGGASTGIELALGRPVDIAINHDPEALAMHKANNPYTLHYCENVWDINPLEVTRGRKVVLSWFSPDCKHFSKAKGGKPVEKHIRGLAWVAVRWADLVRPRVIILENVEEFKTWGRIGADGKPDPKHKGETFRSFVRALEHFGYKVEWKEMRACDYGAPTIRKRFILVARCDGNEIVFPQATHGKARKPFRTASECIDFNIQMKSIFDRKKPLVEATLKRIAMGIDKFIINNPKPFIMQMNYNNVPQDIDKPLSTVTTVGHHFLIAPYLAKFNQNSSGSQIDKPLSTVTSIDHNSLVMAFLMTYYKSGDNAQSLEKPMRTVLSKSKIALVTIEGVGCTIMDIKMRMLEPKELAAAQGFPKDYIINHDINGKSFSKAKQVRFIGNSVCPALAEALVRANLPELAYKQAIKSMKQVDRVVCGYRQIEPIEK